MSTAISKTPPRYEFKTERELTKEEKETMGKLAQDLKKDNPGCGKYLYGELSFDRKLCAFKCVYPSYNGGYDDDYFFIYFSLNQKTGEIKLSHHGDVTLREMELTVSPEMETRIIAFLRSITISRAFNVRKHVLASRKNFLNSLAGVKNNSPPKSARRNVTRRRR